MAENQSAETISIYEASADKREVAEGQKAWKYIRELNGLKDGDLDKIAVIDAHRKYTYARMFKEWERYASVFTALGMTEEQNARVGVLGSTCAEVIFAFYGLNMVGAQTSLVASWSAFSFDKIKATILQENLTDIIITDDLAQPELVSEILNNRKELRLRNVIVMHVTMAGATAMPVLTAVQEAKAVAMKSLYWPICMETLLARYGSGPAHITQQEAADTTLIIHTTGTTTGTGKPVPMSDSALNAVVGSFMQLKDFKLPFDHLVTATMLDLSNSYGIINQVHLAFGMGATLVTVPLGFLNPWFYKAIAAYRISFLFSAGYMFDRWMKMPEDTDFDFSSLKCVALGGTAVSAAEKHRYNEFIEAHGGKDVAIINGYGLSELGGACCLSSADLDDETVGYALPGITIRLFDEDKKRFFSPKSKGGEGVLYMTSPTMAAYQLDGRDVIKVEFIDRKPYVCTNDLVRMEPDGRIIYLSRANRFFMRQEGRKYESGRVEAEFSRQEGIDSCGIVPVYYKIQHDTLPMLCVQTLDDAGEPKDVVLAALRRVFIENKILGEDNVPSRVMLVEELPRNTNGKVDLARLNQGGVSGDVYTVDEVRGQDDELTDFQLTPFVDASGDVVEQVIDGISADFKNSNPVNKLLMDLEEVATSASDVSTNSAPAMPAMPSIPGMPAMPSIPGMPAMPAMPMPAMPASGESPWALLGLSGDGKEQITDFMSGMRTLMEQQANMQRASMQVHKDWWDSFFGW